MAQQEVGQMHARAQKYTNLGFSVAPAMYGLKKAKVDWTEFQTRKPTQAELEKWFSNGQSNLLIITGAISGIVVVDCDSPEAIEFAEKHLAATPMRTKTKRGYQLFYKHSGVPIKNSVKLKSPDGTIDLDIRGDGGLVVAPGSLHPSDDTMVKSEYNALPYSEQLKVALKGGVYYQEVTPWTSEMVQALPIFDPSFLEKYGTQKQNNFRRVRSGKAINSMIRQHLNKIPGAIEGNGGDSLTFRVACDLVIGFELTVDDALPYFELWNDKCDPPWNESDLVAKLESALKSGSGEPGYLNDRNPRYGIDYGKIVYNKRTGDGVQPIPLCNFTAKIVSEETRDDGAEQKTFFRIEGELAKGGKLRSIEVPAETYATMNWVNNEWGGRPIVNAGDGARDKLRAAIQELSGDFEQRHVYAHLGWVKDNDKWVYLHAGGAIGSAGALSDINVSVSDGRLSHYTLPTPPKGEELNEAIQTSLSFLDLAPKPITVPLLGATYRAPLGEASLIDSAIFLTGPSGTRKSEISAMAQAHFGSEFRGKNLPGNWYSTENALERQAFLTKDAIFTVDDFAPRGSKGDVEKLQARADRFFRSIGNRSGRGRMRADGSLRPDYFPRCMVVSSGEDIPKGHSIRARIFICPVAPNDVDLSALTAFQQKALEGLPAKSMAGFIQWLASQYEQLRKDLPHRQIELRAKASTVGSHGRTPETVASIYVGVELFLRFALESGAIDQTKHDELLSQCWDTLCQAGNKQQDHQRSEDMTVRFLELLRAAFSSGKAHVVDEDGAKPPTPFEPLGWDSEGSIPRSPKIGWADEDKLYLEPDSTFMVIQQIAQAQGDHIANTKTTMWKRLAEKGIIIPDANDQRNTQRIKLEKARRTVVVIPRSYIEDDK